MRVATYHYGGKRHVGVVDRRGGTVSPLEVPEADAETGILCLIGKEASGIGAPIALSDVRLEAPIPRPPRNIFCVGKNYFDHAHEFARSGFDSSSAKGAVPSEPIIFSKVPECVIGPEEDVLIDPTVSESIDYEAELAVIIGTGGRGISKDRAVDHVWGYTIVNDVTARDLQGRYSQWIVGKSQDTFCPMGPWAVTADEIDVADTAIRCRVNGETRQDSNTGLLIFDIPTIIATISQGVTLIPGDVIATGTPAGVGIGFDPPKYLEPGDVMEVEIDGIGTLRNRCKRRGT
ncbi:fumarylacetoacetate hydrolase family protein [Sagittula salina]|uniref:Fumarylacetoacetate hydrolase family protein n=1 Tax=Sagittula salina TaxID=2820268 RepID=A0A940S162_9RHOB|nr:fumarylacetoacetate hydrolase family protein [Sagittula salina]MBP0482796.1 fumarylacetoacetate hydrolase family protein [Sagittula salina]